MSNPPPLRVSLYFYRLSVHIIPPIIFPLVSEIVLFYVQYKKNPPGYALRPGGQ